jgi:hypothetical protein
MQEVYNMSHKEVTRLEILQRLLQKRLRQKQAANILQISVRQVRRILKSYHQEGAVGIISKKRGKVSNNKVADTVTEYAITLIKQHYVDFGPTLAAEKLLEQHGLKLSVETVRKLMITANIWLPKSQRAKRSYQPRYRRERFGELIQIDGSSHYWFEDRGSKCTLLVYVDDATSKLTSLYFAPSESLYTYCLATKQHIEKHGKPMAFYSDKFGVFKVNYKETQKDKIMTQFGRALYELNIDLICANSCQAKGRVERANLTLQDRLVKELRLQNISNIADANAYLPIFIKDYNQRFAKTPQSDINAHRPLQNHESLQETLCFKQERTVTNNLTIQHDRVMYLIEDTVANRALRRHKVMLHEYHDGSISLNYEGKKLTFSKLYDKVTPVEQGAVVPNERLDSIMRLITEKQNIQPFKRSTSCPRKKHLDVICRKELPKVSTAAIRGQHHGGSVTISV